MNWRNRYHMRFRANFLAFWPSGRWPLALLRRAKTGNLHEISCGSDFANMKRPSYPANKTQLQALRKSQRNSSNLLHRFWAVSIDSGRCLLKLPAERGRIAQKCAEFLAPIGLQEFCRILSGPGAVPRPTKVRCLEETRHLAEFTANAGA